MMAERLNLTNKVVTGGRFVATSGKRISAKEYLNNLQASVESIENADMSNYIMSILNDNVLTPVEKISLKSRWSYIRSSYYRLVTNIEDAFGDTQESELDELRVKYSELETQISKLFDDMNSNSTVPSSFQTSLEEFVSEISELSSVFSNALFEYTKYEIQLSCNKSSFNDDDTVVVTATLYYDGTEYSGGYDKLSVEWSTNLPDFSASEHSDKNVLSFPASLFTGNLTVDCSMELPISTL